MLVTSLSHSPEAVGLNLWPWLLLAVALGVVLVRHHGGRWGRASPT